MAPVDDPLAAAEIQTVLDLQLADTALAWELGPDGSWTRIRPPEGEAPRHCQDALMEYVSRQARAPGA